MAAGVRLDDFLSKKKEVVQVLDLSKSVARTKEDLKKLLDKVPEFKTKAEKVHPEDIKIRDKDWTFKITKKELRYVPEYSFANPVPAEMRSIKLDDLISVPIDWRMLTTLRPKTKLEEDFFSRLIELGKLTLQTLQYERQKEGPRSNYAATSSSWIKRFKSRGGVVETKATTCNNCGEEFCDSSVCKLFTYDCFFRSSLLPGDSTLAGGSTDKSGQATTDKERGRTKKKKKRQPSVRNNIKSAKSVQPTKGKKSRETKGKGSEKRHRSTSAGRGGGRHAGSGKEHRHRSVSAPPVPKKSGARKASPNKGHKK